MKAMAFAFPKTKSMELILWYLPNYCIIISSNLQHSPLWSSAWVALCKICWYTTPVTLTNRAPHSWRTHQRCLVSLKVACRCVDGTSSMHSSKKLGILSTHLLPSASFRNCLLFGHDCLTFCLIFAGQKLVLGWMLWMAGSQCLMVL